MDVSKTPTAGTMTNPEPVTDACTPEEEDIDASHSWSPENEHGDEELTSIMDSVASELDGRTLNDSLGAISQHYRDSDSSPDVEMPFLENNAPSSGDYLISSDVPESPPKLQPSIDTRIPKMAFLEELDNPGLSSSARSSPPLRLSVSPSYLDIFDLNQLLKSMNGSSFLSLPLLSGFERTVLERATKIHGTASEVFYRVERTGQLLKNLDEVHGYLLETNKEIPISFFCFDPEILTNAEHKADPDVIFKEDLSEGNERVPVPVICAKNKKSGRLGNYITASFLAKDIKKALSPNHDEGFLVCCNCPNDCKDKMNCPCFLKTLDNCSEKTRRLIGDEKVGYNYQRLEHACLTGIFECNKLCKCHKQTCFNRVVQNGMFCNLQIFMTRLKGWGVRTTGDIPKGTFICTYAGKIIGPKYAEKVSKDWNEGRWKYLSELRIGEEGKPDYEEEAIEPELETEEVASNLLNEKDGDSVSEAKESNTQTSAVPIVPLPAIASTSQAAMELDLKTTEIACKNEKKTRNRKRIGTREASNTQTSGNPLNVQERPKRLKSLAPSIDRQFGGTANVKTEDNTDFDLYSVKRLHSIIRTVEDLELTAMLTYRSFLKQRYFPIVPRTSAHAMNTKFIFREDRDEHCPSKILLKKGKLFQAVERRNHSSKLMKLEKISIISDREITKKAAESVLSSMKFPEKQTNQSTSPPKVLQRKLKHPATVTKRITNRSKFPLKRSRKRAAVSGNRRTKAANKKFVAKRLGSRRRPDKQVHQLLDFSLNIDGLEYKNVGGYLNHSCSPNVFPQYAFWDCHDLRFPVIGFFAARNIRRGEELCWNYKYEIEEFLKGEEKLNRKRIQLPCYCNADNCTRTMYSSENE